MEVSVFSCLGDLSLKCSIWFCLVFVFTLHIEEKKTNCLFSLFGCCQAGDVGFFVTLNKEECCTVFYMTRPALFATVYSYIYLHLKCAVVLDAQPVMMGT